MVDNSPIESLPFKTRVRMSGPASGGTIVSCAWHQGCSAQYNGSRFTNAEGARYEARHDGWLVAQDGGRYIGLGRTQRLDYCPAHANRERERRGKPIRGSADT